MIERSTLEDLELEKVKQAVAQRCRSAKGAALALRIGPYNHYGALQRELAQTDEYLGALRGGGGFPETAFEAADRQIKLLGVENSVLSAGDLLLLADISGKTNTLIDYLDTYRDYFPAIRQKLRYVYRTDGVVAPVERAVDPDANLRDEASPALREIRMRIRSIHSSIDRFFNLEMARCRAEGLLDEIGESIVDHRRVLAVSAAARRKVRGAALGTSRTGSIVFIEPEATVRLSHELALAQQEEQLEIRRILQELTAEIRPYAELLAACEKLLTEMDLLQGKAHYALETGACLPRINREGEIALREAYHPILLLQNKAQGLPTYPQDIVFGPQRRIIAISGPNAGGKSITLKTVGLLQLMLQCGLLIPVHPSSTTCLFQHILTDIGDNQSIENHLSTYSYRLKKMAEFLRVCDSRTLFLIDEFGTGSDPDLGGALAAVFLEEFYRRGAYGVLTTHYTNIKLLVENLPQAVNASMLFDEKTLEPKYKLYVGQAGSSFTFEVAQINGIPRELIERAKTRVEHDKIVLDRTIAALQKEKSNILEQSRSLSSARKKADATSQALEKTQEKVQAKLEAYQELFDHNARRIQLGRRMEGLMDAYFFKKQTKKAVLAELTRIVEAETARRAEKAAELLKEKEKQQPAAPAPQRAAKKETPPSAEPDPGKEIARAQAAARKALQAQRKDEEERLAQAEKNIEEEIAPIRTRKAEELAALRQEQQRPQTARPIAAGDRVRLAGGYSVGTVDRIEKQTAYIDYGWFITQAPLSELELVEKRS